MMNKESMELVTWANNLMGVEEKEPKHGGIHFSDEMKDRFDSFDALNKDIENQDEALDWLVKEWKETHSSVSLVQIMAIGYKYIIGVMMKKDSWKHLTPDEAITAAFKALPRSISIYVPGRSKFLSFWARGAEMAWTAQKAKTDDQQCSARW